MASMQRLLKRPPEPDEVAAVRSRSLQRLAAIADRDRIALVDGDEPTDGTDGPELTASEPMAVDSPVDSSNPPDPTEPDEDTETIDANDDAASEPWRLQGPWRLVAQEDGDAESPVEAADAAIDDGATAAPEGELVPATMIALGEPEAAAGDPEAAGDPDAVPSAEAEVADATTADPIAANRVEPASQVVLFPVPDAVVDAAPAVVDAAPAAIAAPETAYCPYCATTLRPAPRATRRCPQCRQKIVVRQVDERIVYLVEAALPVFEAERRRLAAIERWAALRDHWLALALASGAPRDRVTRATSEVASEAKVAAARALYVATVDHAVETAMREDRWEDAAHLRYDQALILFDSLGTPVPQMADDRALRPTLTASR